MTDRKETSTEHMQRYYEKKVEKEEQNLVTGEKLSLQVFAKIQVKL